MSKREKAPKGGLTKDPLMHQPFAGLSLDSLLGEIAALPPEVTEAAPAEMPKPLSVTPSGTSELMNDDGGEENFGPETADGLDTAPANTSMLPPPMPEPAIPMARAINGYGVTGDNQPTKAGVESDPLILDARYDDGTAAVGEPVFWMVVDGNGSFYEHGDQAVLGDGSAATTFTPDTDAPWKVVAIVGSGETEVEVSFASQVAKAAMPVPTPEFVEAMERALPPAEMTTTEVAPEVVEEAPSATNTIEAVSETTVAEATSPVDAAAANATPTPAAPVSTSTAEVASPAPEASQTTSTEEELARAEEELKAAGIAVEGTNEHVSKPAPMDDEINDFIQEGANLPDTSSVRIPPASPIPREEVGVTAAVQRTVRRTHMLGRKHVAWAGGALMLIALAIGYIQRSDTGTTSPAANLQSSVATEASKAKTAAAATTSVEYSCAESTRTTDPSDGQYDILTCARVAK